VEVLVMTEAMMLIGGSLIFAMFVTLIFYFEPSRKEARETEQCKDYFRIRYNPKKDITAYELAKLQSILGPFAYTQTLIVRRNSETDMEAWNKIPVLMQRHFDIVEDTRL
jgi:hypothetical protein